MTLSAPFENPTPESPSPLPGRARELKVRIGIHSGLVVIGDIGTSGRTEQLALGETPNIAARIQGLAEPNTVMISAATQRLIDGQFESQLFGSHVLKGIESPIAVYQVQGENQSGSHLEGKPTLTPLIGREQEVGLLLDRWEQAKEGCGQVVLLSGEPGIGKSRLAYTLREHVTSEGSLLFEARCSPYYQHSVFYPLIEAMQRTLGNSRCSPRQVSGQLRTSFKQVKARQKSSKKQRSVFSKRLRLRKVSKPNPRNCARQPASRGCGINKLYRREQGAWSKGHATRSTYQACRRSQVVVGHLQLVHRRV